MEQHAVFKTIPKIDTTTAPKMDQGIKELLSDPKLMELEIDMEETFYISSVGLRVLLATQKAMNARKGTLYLSHVRSQVREIFDVTGFSGFLNVVD